MTPSWHPCPMTAAAIAREIAAYNLRMAQVSANTHRIKAAWAEMREATERKMRAEIEAAR